VARLLTCFTTVLNITITDLYLNCVRILFTYPVFNYGHCSLHPKIIYYRGRFYESGYLSDDLDHFQSFVYTNSGRGYQLEDSPGKPDKRYPILLTPSTIFRGCMAAIMSVLRKRGPYSASSSVDHHQGYECALLSV